MIRIKDWDGWFFSVGNLRMEKVRDWYMDTYPDDSLGKEIDKNVTMWDVVSLLNAGLGSRFYDFTKVGDSVIRERVFARVAKVAGCDYDDVYDAWLKSA